ncbi:sporulation protein YunB [Heliorestis acidaminivorans]|uniref:Sporulation protein YunB n=1 Tax=Heliorestis acidaminivorans TaxID=553427 RepID=A0A6I0EQH1_9FIRM|nr:sporulation protein YunB [Heliorestis acidaminivorans]KAB2951580.1 sporulation protein YunB [Heliorestis acidaminivorans]
MFWLRLRWLFERWRGRLLIIFITVPLLLLLSLPVFFVYAENNLRSTVIAMAEARGKALAVEAINEAIRHRIANQNEFQDLIIYKTDQQGRIVLLQPNTIMINHLAAETALEVQDTLSNLNSTELKIPLGQISGSSLFANRGPTLPVRILPIGTVQVKAVETFEEAGINQTKFMVFLDIETVVRIVVPMVTSDMAVNTIVPISTTIIPGEVPHVYMGGNSGIMPSIDISKTAE